MWRQEDSCVHYVDFTTVAQAEEKKERRKKRLLQFKEHDFTWRGKPNESLGLGSVGQLAGGNEVNQSGGKNRMAEWGRHIWAELGK